MSPELFEVEFSYETYGTIPKQRHVSTHLVGNFSTRSRVVFARLSLCGKSQTVHILSTS